MFGEDGNLLEGWEKNLRNLGYTLDDASAATLKAASADEVEAAAS